MKSHIRISKGASLLVLLLMVGMLLQAPAVAGGDDDPLTGVESTGEAPPPDQDPTLPTGGADPLTEWLLWWLTLAI